MASTFPLGLEGSAPSEFVFCTATCVQEPGHDPRSTTIRPGVKILVFSFISSNLKALRHLKKNKDHFNYNTIKCYINIPVQINTCNYKSWPSQRKGLPFVDSATVENSWNVSDSLQENTFWYRFLVVAQMSASISLSPYYILWCFEVRTIQYFL